MTSEIPEHMRDEAEFYDHGSPQFYEEADCHNCAKRIYRYKLDLIVEWKHLDHSTRCWLSPRAMPKQT